MPVPQRMILFSATGKMPVPQRMILFSATGKMPVPQRMIFLWGGHPARPSKAC